MSCRCNKKKSEMKTSEITVKCNLCLNFQQNRDESHCNVSNELPIDHAIFIFFLICVLFLLISHDELKILMNFFYG